MLSTEVYSLPYNAPHHRGDSPGCSVHVPIPVSGQLPACGSAISKRGLATGKGEREGDLLPLTSLAWK